MGTFFEVLHLLSSNRRMLTDGVKTRWISLCLERSSSSKTHYYGGKSTKMAHLKFIEKKHVFLNRNYLAFSYVSLPSWSATGMESWNNKWRNEQSWRQSQHGHDFLHPERTQDHQVVPFPVFNTIIRTSVPEEARAFWPSFSGRAKAKNSFRFAPTFRR